MSFEISGRLAVKYETQRVSDRFQKREFILEVKSNSSTGYEFVDYIKFQSTQDRCSLLDQFEIDDQLKVAFNLRGRKWEKDGQVNYFTNLEAWRIEKDAASTPESNFSSPAQDQAPDNDAPFPTNPPESDSNADDDLPF